MFSFGSSIPKPGGAVAFVVLTLSKVNIYTTGVKDECSWEYKEQGWRLVECLVVSRLTLEDGRVRLTLQDEIYQHLTLKENEAIAEVSSSHGWHGVVRIQ